MPDKKLRMPREQETREKHTRKKAWERPETLPNPIPEDGYCYRWIRIATRGVSDATNVSSKIREGWEPVRADVHPEIFADAVIDDRFKDNIVIGGLMLCKAPEEMVNERNDYYKQQTAAQMQSVDNNLMRESDPRMPIFNDRKSTVSFGKG
tara:strand:- start:212 stop:664 length:453 start_codon:yes stop_codon:yes gene_type:complete